MKVEVKCYNCGAKFFRRKADVTRNTKIGKPVFCGLGCSATYGNHISPRGGDPSRLKPDNRLDEFSPFRVYLKVAKQHQGSKQLTITVEDLKRVWERQNGRCVYTHKQMLLPRTIADHKREMTRASLDRIDSKKGYTPDNVQFVCMAVNFAKNNFTDSEVREFFRGLAQE